MLKGRKKMDGHRNMHLWFLPNVFNGCVKIKFLSKIWINPEIRVQAFNNKTVLKILNIREKKRSIYRWMVLWSSVMLLRIDANMLMNHIGFSILKRKFNYNNNLYIF